MTQGRRRRPTSPYQGRASSACSSCSVTAAGYFERTTTGPVQQVLKDQRLTFPQPVQIVVELVYRGHNQQHPRSTEHVCIIQCAFGRQVASRQPLQEVCQPLDATRIRRQARVPGVQCFSMQILRRRHRVRDQVQQVLLRVANRGQVPDILADLLQIRPRTLPVINGLRTVFCDRILDDLFVHAQHKDAVGQVQVDLQAFEQPVRRFALATIQIVDQDRDPLILCFSLGTPGAINP